MSGVVEEEELLPTAVAEKLAAAVDAAVVIMNAPLLERYYY